MTGSCLSAKVQLSYGLFGMMLTVLTVGYKPMMLRTYTQLANIVSDWPIL